MEIATQLALFLANKPGTLAAVCDALAAESHRRAHIAWEEGKFDSEVVPVEWIDRKGNTTVFRTCGRDDVQGATVGAYIIKNNKNAKIAVLHDKSPYGKGVADETVKALAKGGIKPAMYEAYLERYPDGAFAALAKLRLDELGSSPPP